MIDISDLFGPQFIGLDRTIKLWFILKRDQIDL